MTDTKPTIGKQIEKLKLLINDYEYGNVDAGIWSDILSSLEELRRIKELLREPSEEMCIKGDETGMFICGDECCHDHSDCAETVWESMSSALLAQVSKDMNDE